MGESWNLSTMSKRTQGNELGRRIKAARERQEWTQVELAQRVGVGAKTISNWETGATLPMNRMGRLIEVLGPGIDPSQDVRVTSVDPSAEVRMLFAHYGDLSAMDLLRLSRLVSEEAVRRSE
jgi:transcriptional regulator with XRE-family HTH domain